MSTRLQAQVKATSIPASPFAPVPSGVFQHRSANQAGPAAAPPSAQEALHSPGRPRFERDFSCVRVRTIAPEPIQAKLTIGHPGDKYEQEADRVADLVTRMPEPRTLGGTAVSGQAQRSSIQRLCPESEEGVRGQPGADEEEVILTRQAGGHTLRVGPSLQARIHSLGGDRQPLPQSVRDFFEPRFGYDFSQVRVHAGGQAAEAARAVNARAFTLGRDIILGAGEYSPRTTAGRELLAHELTHVVQQGKAQAFAPLGPSSNVFPAGNRIQMKAKKGRRCGGPWVCASTDTCTAPDKAGKGGKPAWWKLIVRIDIDVPALEDITVPADVGHVYVKFVNSTGTQWTYGFYPKKTPIISPIYSRLIVPGCMVHPDTRHDPCVDYDETFDLTEEAFNKALALAQKHCRKTPRYNVKNYTCTTFAREVAKAAGKSLPSGKGKIKSYSTTVESDWPNVVLEALRKRDALLKEKRKRTERTPRQKAEPTSRPSSIPARTR